MKDILEKQRKVLERYQKMVGRYPKNMCGLCAISANRVYRKLASIVPDIKPAATKSFPYHAFCITNELVIDITATQFGDDRIYVAPLKENFNKMQYNDPAIFKDNKQMEEFLLADGWPKSQVFAKKVA